MEASPPVLCLKASFGEYEPSYIEDFDRFFITRLCAVTAEPWKVIRLCLAFFCLEAIDQNSSSLQGAADDLGELVGLHQWAMERIRVLVTRSFPPPAKWTSKKAKYHARRAILWAWSVGSALAKQAWSPEEFGHGYQRALLMGHRDLIPRMPLDHESLNQVRRYKKTWQTRSCS